MLNNDEFINELLDDDMFKDVLKYLDLKVEDEIKSVKCSINGTIENSEVHVNILGSGNKRMALILLIHGLMTYMEQSIGDFGKVIEMIMFYHDRFGKHNQFTIKSVKPIGGGENHGE